MGGGVGEGWGREGWGRGGGGVGEGWRGRKVLTSKKKHRTCGGTINGRQGGGVLTQKDTQLGGSCYKGTVTSSGSLRLLFGACFRVGSVLAPTNPHHVWFQASGFHVLTPR